MLRVRTIRSKVAGVSFPNPDGSSRQRIIRKLCRAGTTLRVRLEPQNRYGENAIGLWVLGRWLLMFPTEYQIGYINEELATGLRRDIDDGCSISVRILDVTGGGWFRKRFYGVNIEIRLESEVIASHRGRRTQSSTRRSAVNVATQSNLPPGPIPSPSLSGSAVASIFSSFGTMAVGTAGRLRAEFLGLSPSRRSIAVGALGSLMGVVVWVAGYFFSKPSGLLSLLRPAGVVAVIIGAGVVSLGIVFSSPEPSKERRE
jgi:hypothetical protein